MHQIGKIAVGLKMLVAPGNIAADRDQIGLDARDQLLHGIHQNSIGRVVGSPLVGSKLRIGQIKNRKRLAGRFLQGKHRNSSLI